MADQLRRSELHSALVGAVRDVRRQATGRVLVLSGEAGIGKTWLAVGAANEARSLGVALWAAGAAQLDRATPYALLARIADDDGSRMFDLGELREAGGARTFGGLPLGGEAGRFEVVESVLATVEARCARPTLVILEDLQWADPASLAALPEVAALTATQPLVLLLTRRPAERAPDLDRVLTRLDAVDLPVEPLLPDEVDDLLRELCGARPSDELARRARGASGNPLLLREYAVGLLSEGRLVDQGGEVDVVAADVPAQLRSAVAERVGALDEDSANVVRAAAVLGAVLDVAVLGALLDRTPLALSTSVQAAIDADLFEARGPHLAFRNDLVRDAVYTDLPLAVR